MISPEVMSAKSGLSYIVCNYILSAARARNSTRLAILAEKHLLSGEESEQLKDWGLTVLDTLTEKFDNRGRTYHVVSQILDDWNGRLGEPIFTLN